MLKHCTCVQTEAPSTSGRSSELDATNSGAVHSRATVTYRQPVLQNAGFGTAGGVQVSLHVVRMLRTPMSHKNHYVLMIMDCCILIPDVCGLLHPVS